MSLRYKKNSMKSSNRRSFLQSTLAGGAATAISPVLLPALAGGRANAAISHEPTYGSVSVQPFELDEITIPELQDGMA